MTTVQGSGCRETAGWFAREGSVHPLRVGLL